MKSLTRDCRIFDSSPSEIVLPDGTSFPNPRRPQVDNGPVFPTQAVYSASMIETANKTASETIQARARLAKYLSAEKDISEDFRMNLLSDPQLGILMGVDLDRDGNFITPPYLMQGPLLIKFFWPPNGNQQKYQDVDISQLIEFLNSKRLSSKTKNELKTVLQLQKKTTSLYGSVNTEAQEAVQKQKMEKEAFLQKRRARAVALIAVAKRSFDKIFNSNSSQKDAQSLKATIDNLNFKFEDELTPDLKKECANGPNAFYYPPLHTFVICNSILNYPDNQLVGIIGHEMGHSISSCNLTLGLDKVDPTMLDSLIEKPTINGNSGDLNQLIEIKGNLPSNLAVRISNDYIMSDTFVKYADSVQLYTPIVKKIKKEDYPLASAKQCIVNNSKFRDVSKIDAKKLTDGTAKIFNERGSKISAADLVDLQERNEKLIECTGGLDKVSETDEAISDMWGSLAMEEYLTENPPKTDLERFSLYSFFGSSYCAEHTEKANYVTQIRPQQLSLNQLKAVAKTGEFQKQDRFSRRHPTTEVRLNDVYFSMPKIAQSLGCGVGKNSECFDKLKNFARAPATQTSSESIIKDAEANK